MFTQAKWIHPCGVQQSGGIGEAGVHRGREKRDETAQLL